MRFPAPITRDGPGFRADIDLPPGVTAGDVIERRDRLASGLRRPEGCVWPEADPDTHAGRLILWVGDKPMSKTKPVAWPLLKTGTVDLFAPFPIGVDPRGRPVTVTLMFALMIIGALPRMGKTFLLRLLALAAALDPTAELHMYDLKGGADWLPLEPVAHRFRVGDDPDDLAYFRADVRADPRRHVPPLQDAPHPAARGLPGRQGHPRRWPTGATLGLFPVVLVIDECQLAFDGDTDTVALVTDLGKRGPAAGIIVILATQRVDAEVLPTGISSNAVLRFCLKVAGQVENDMVLGTIDVQGRRPGHHVRPHRPRHRLPRRRGRRPGHRPHRLPRRQPRRRTVVARARAARLAAGTAHRPRRRHRARPRPGRPVPARPPRRGLAAHRGGARRQGLVGRPRRPARRHLPRPVRRLDRRAGLRRGPAARAEVRSRSSAPSTAASSTAAASTRTDLAAALRARDAEDGAEQLDQAPTAGPSCPAPTTNLDDDRSDLR